MTDLLNPLSPADLAKIEAALASLKEVDLAIEKAKRAGIDLGTMEAAAAAAKAKLQALKQVYFPNG